VDPAASVLRCIEPTTSQIVSVSFLFVLANITGLL